MILNYALIGVLILCLLIFIGYLFKKSDSSAVLRVDRSGRTYTIEQMTAFIKDRMDEITRTNLYDIGLSEEEMRRRKNKKYELKKALKGCTYGARICRWIRIELL